MKNFLLVSFILSFNFLVGQEDTGSTYVANQRRLFLSTCGGMEYEEALKSTMDSSKTLILSDSCLFLLFDDYLTPRFRQYVRNRPDEKFSIRRDTNTFLFVQQLIKSGTRMAIELSNDLCNMSGMLPYLDLTSELCDSELMHRKSAQLIQEAYLERLKFLQSRIYALKEDDRCDETVYLFYEVFSYRKVRLLKSDFDESLYFEPYTQCVYMLGDCFGFLPSVARDFGIKPSFVPLFNSKN